MAIHSDSFAILRDCRALFLKHLGALLQDSQLVSGHAISAIQQGAGAYFDEIVSTAEALLDDSAAYAAMARGVSPYGDGYAARRIERILADAFGSA